MKNLFKHCAVSALLMSSVAFAALVPITNVIELEYSQIQIPVHEADRMTLSDCRACPSGQLQVTGETVYRFNSSTVTLIDFRAAVRTADATDEMIFLVTYDVETSLITRIVAKGGWSASR